MGNNKAILAAGLKLLVRTPTMAEEAKSSKQPLLLQRNSFSQVHHLTIRCLSVQRVSNCLDSFAYFSYQEEK
jgi:hypothetical protein